MLVFNFCNPQSQKKNYIKYLLIHKENIIFKELERKEIIRMKYVLLKNGYTIKFVVAKIKKVKFQTLRNNNIYQYLTLTSSEEL